MKTLLVGLSVLYGAVALIQPAVGDDRTKEHDSKLTTSEFVKKAGAGGASEVKLGQLVAEKATDPDVKAFAQRMVTDHTKANEELQAAAKAKGLEAPTSPGMMEKATMEKFKLKAADKDFDRAYMEHMVKDHEEDIELFQSAANGASVDPEIQQLARKTLPMLESHLKEAQTIESKLAR